MKFFNYINEQLESSEKKFRDQLKALYPNGIIGYHETFVDKVPSIKTHGISCEDGDMGMEGCFLLLVDPGDLLHQNIKL